MTTVERGSAFYDRRPVCRPLTAAIWDPQLHPRGHDGRFIELGGIIRFLTGDNKDKRGKVTDIKPGDGGDSKITVQLDDGSSVDVSPNDIEQAAEKARLNVPAAPEKKKRGLFHKRDRTWGKNAMTQTEFGNIMGVEPGESGLTEGQQDLFDGDARQEWVDRGASPKEAFDEVASRREEGREVGPADGTVNQREREVRTEKGLPQQIAAKPTPEPSAIRPSGKGRSIEAGNINPGDKVMMPGQDIEATVTDVRPTNADNMEVHTDMGMIPAKFSDPIELVSKGPANQTRPPAAPAAKKSLVYNATPVKSFAEWSGYGAIAPDAEPLHEFDRYSNKYNDDLKDHWDSLPLGSPGRKRAMYEMVRRKSAYREDRTRREAAREATPAKAPSQRDLDRQFSRGGPEAYDKANRTARPITQQDVAGLQRLDEAKAAGQARKARQVYVNDEILLPDGSSGRVGQMYRVGPRNGPPTIRFVTDNGNVDVGQDDPVTVTKSKVTDWEGFRNPIRYPDEESISDYLENPGTSWESAPAPEAPETPNAPEANTTLTPEQATEIATKVEGGEPVPPPKFEDQDLDDVLLQMENSPNPVDLTLMPQFEAMRQSGIPRSEMPQIHKEHLQEFQDLLNSRGTSVTPEVVDPRSLTATQAELDGKSVGGMIDANKAGRFDLAGNPIWISNDNHVLDGHHRWAAATAVTANCDGCLQMPVLRVDMPMSELLEFARQFNRDKGVKAQKFGEVTPYESGKPGGSNFAPVPTGPIAAAGPPVPDENGYYTMATDEEDGITDEDVAGLPVGVVPDGSAFPGYLDGGDEEPPEEPVKASAFYDRRPMYRPLGGTR